MLAILKRNPEKWLHAWWAKRDDDDGNGNGNGDNDDNDDPSQDSDPDAVLRRMELAVGRNAEECAAWSETLEDANDRMEVVEGEVRARRWGKMSKAPLISMLLKSRS